MDFTLLTSNKKREFPMSRSTLQATITHLVLNGLANLTGGLDDSNTAVPTTRHEQPHELVHGDYGHHVRREHVEIGAVRGPGPRVCHKLLLSDDLVPQRLEPAKKERLDVG